MTANSDSVAPDREPVPVTGVVRVCLLLGRILFGYGATAQRIQNSVSRLASHLGCNVEILVSDGALLFTVSDGETLRARVDSSRRVAGLNLLGLARVSRLLRGPAPFQTNPGEIEPAWCAIRDTPPVNRVVGQVFAALNSLAPTANLNEHSPWPGSRPAPFPIPPNRPPSPAPAPA